MRELSIPEIVRIANANNIIMDGSMDPVLNLVEGNDVVICVWQDFSKAHGVSFCVIKGAALLRESVAHQRPFNAKVTAIKCVEEAQALSLKGVCGEPDQLN